MTARTRHRWRAATAWTAIVALLFHVAILVAPSSVRAADGLGNSVILCSSFGQYSVALADLDGGQVPDHVPEKGSAPDGSFFCPLCFAAHLLGAALPSAETSLPPPNGPIALIRVAHHEGDASGLRTVGSGPRAPPSIV